MPTRDPLSWLELKVPPPVVVLLGVLLFEALVWVSFPAILPALWIVSFFSIAFAAWFGISGVYGCLSHKTTIHPWDPSETSTLVVDGIFQYTRNPMYVALLFVLVAYLCLKPHPVGPAVFACVMWFLHRFQVMPEERMLAQKFGDAYAAYCNRVRRWL